MQPEETPQSHGMESGDSISVRRRPTDAADDDSPPGLVQIFPYILHDA